MQKIPTSNTTDSSSELQRKEAENALFRWLPLVFLFVSYALIIFEQSSRMFWPYMVTSYLMAGVLYYSPAFRGREKPAGSLIEYLFPRDVWFSPSAVNDYLLFIVNYVIYFHILALLAIEPDVVVRLIAHYFHAFGIAQNTANPGLFVAILYTACFLLLAELFYYITHRAYHEIPLLWEFHKVHHSAEVMTPLTYIRAHPFDLWIQNCMKLLATGISTGVFLYFYPNLKGVIMVAGLDAGIFIYYVLGANLHHSHIRLSFGRKLEHIFISPAQHQVHHSDNPKHYNMNYGSMLAVWDWLFGSLYLIRGDEKIRFGLGDSKEQEKYNSVWKLYIHPVKRAWTMILGVKRV